MCKWLRNTVSRPRSAVPATFWRTRTCRRRRPSSRVSRIVLAPLARSLAGGLAGLVTHGLALLADALALVRLWRPAGADVRRHLADALAARAAHRDRRRALALDLDADRHRELDRVRIPERHDQRLALDLGFVADAADLELLR